MLELIFNKFLIWTVAFPLCGIALQEFGLEHPAYFAFYGVMYSAIYFSYSNKQQ